MIEKDLGRIADALELIATLMVPPKELAKVNAPVAMPEVKTVPLVVEKDEETISTKQMANMLKPGALTALGRVPGAPVVKDEGTELDRTKIRAELDAMGIEYKTRSNTKTLFNLLEKSRIPHVQSESPKSPEVINTAPTLMPSPAKAPTILPIAGTQVVAEENLLAESPSAVEIDEPVKVNIDDARETLKNFADEHGSDKAKAVLKNFNAAKLSDIKPAFLGQLVSAIGIEVKKLTGIFG